MPSPGFNTCKPTEYDETREPRSRIRVPPTYTGQPVYSYIGNTMDRLPLHLDHRDEQRRALMT